MHDPDPPPITVRAPGCGAPQDRPQVTLRGGPEPDAPPETPRPERPAVPVLVLLLLAALAVVVGVDRPPPPPPEPSSPREGIDAELELYAAGVSSTGGVLAVPVVLHNRGGLLRLRSAEAYAEPVRSDTATTAPPSFGPGDSRRFVVLLQPDCRFLTPTSGLSFRAGLLVVVNDRAGASETLGLDLTSDPWVVSAVLDLCERT